MKNGLLLACIFLICTVLQYSMLYAFAGPFLLVSLLTIGGILVFQRVGPEEGMAWFLAMTIVQGFDFYPIFWVFIGPLLLSRVFTTRSLYALFGLGISGHILVSICTGLFEKLAERFFPLSFVPVHPPDVLFLQTIILIPGLLVGIVFVRFIEGHLVNRLYIRQS